LAFIERLPLAVRVPLRELLARNAPQVLYAIRSWRQRRRLRKQWGDFHARMQLCLFGTGPITVLHGPFKGMLYTSAIVHGPSVCKWLGSYEEELHPIMAQILAEGYANVLNAGSAEGYYAVGIARANPTTKVRSFDVDPWARKQQARMAQLNSVRNLVVNGACTLESLSFLAEHGVLICDIEGHELQLLDPRICPPLTRGDVLAEIHDVGTLSANDALKIIVERFETSHEIQIVERRPRDLGFYHDVVCAGRLAVEDVEAGLDEHRAGNQAWVWMRSRQRSGTITK
jgi:hypothetical protein